MSLHQLIKQKQEQIKSLEKEIDDLRNQMIQEYDSKPNVDDIKNLANVYFIETIFLRQINESKYFLPKFCIEYFYEMVDSAIKIGIMEPEKIERNFKTFRENFNSYSDQAMKIISSVKNSLSHINWNESLYEVAEKLGITTINSHMSKIIKCDISATSTHFKLLDSIMKQTKGLSCGHSFVGYNHIRIDVFEGKEDDIIRILTPYLHSIVFDESIEFEIRPADIHLCNAACKCEEDFLGREFISESARQRN